MKEIFRASQMIGQWMKPDGHRFSNIEGNRDCNRRCSYCAVPEQYNREQELTVEQTFQVIDWLHDQDFRLLSYVGGEPLSPFETKEGITFADHTIRVVKYAVAKGMFVNVTTNGDYVTKNTIEALKQASLGALTFSLHNYTERGLNHLVKEAKLSAQAGIIPIIQVVFTKQSADKLPGIAAHTAENGLLFGFGIVQEKGGGFSPRPNGSSLLPLIEQQQKVFHALLRLKTFGFIRNNRDFLTHARDYYPNNWRCDPGGDAFIHIGAGGTVDICSDVRTEVNFGDIRLDDERWRKLKRIRVKDCGNCCYSCYYESENPSLLGDVPMIGVVLLIKTGNTKIAEKWGKFAVAISKKLEQDVDWNLRL